MRQRLALLLVVTVLLTSLGCVQTKPEPTKLGPALSMDEIIQELESAPTDQRMERMLKLQEDLRTLETIQGAEKAQQDRLSKLMDEAKAATPKPAKSEEAQTQKD